MNPTEDNIQLTPEFISLLRECYENCKRNVLAIPRRSKFSPKRFTVAQIYTLVLIRRAALQLKPMAMIRGVNESILAELVGKERVTETQGAIELARRVYDLLTPRGPLTYRKLAEMLTRSAQMRACLDLQDVPHYSTLAKAEDNWFAKK